MTFCHSTWARLIFRSTINRRYDVQEVGFWMRGTKTENLGLRRRRGRGFFGDLELEADAHAPIDHRNAYVGYRRELNELKLAAQKHIPRHRPIKSAAGGDAPEQRIALPRAGR